MATTTSGRWSIWTDGGVGPAMGATAQSTRVYRLADGTYLTVGPDETGTIRELPSFDRPTPERQPIPIQ
jgi:hypothetical protein